MEYIIARKNANRVVELLQPHCNIINIGGSIRRMCPVVKDIEIICLPHKIFEGNMTWENETVQTTLFGEVETAKNIKTEIKQTEINVPEFNSIVNGWQKVKGEPTGRYTQRILPTGITLDLFIPVKNDYWRQFVIRTGSADYSAKVVAKAWVRLGWRGTADGLRRENECELKNGVWNCTVENPTLPPEWKSEEDFFDFIKIKCIHPSKRSL
jgi:DNA polymerase/3'-5' exonuclease PolX